MYNRLVGQKLRNGSPLKITVLPASVEKDILPEVQRMHCAWVIQLWHNHIVDFTPNSGVSADPFAQFNPQLGQPETPVGKDDNLFFSLWNGATRKVLADGSAPLRPAARSGPGEPPSLTPIDALAQQILKRLNQLK
jgi:hypothetical protein